MAIMASQEAASDPLTEQDNLSSQLANLEKQFADRKVKEKDYEVLSKQLKDRIRKAESQTYSLARKDETLARRLRLRDFNDPEIQQVINHFLKAGDKPLEPSFGADRIPRYLVLGTLLVEQRILQKMADSGMLTEALFERVVSCPTCGTPSNLYLRFKCPQCNSIDISLNRMLEHLQCGTIHEENVFYVGRNLICPTCKKMLLNKNEYRVIGLVCSCRVCDAHFEDPAQSYFCRGCKSEFSLPSAQIIDVFSYSMRKGILNEARRFMGVNTLATLLTEKGYAVKTPGVVVGASKEVVFSLTAQKDTKLIAVDVSQSEGEVDVEPILDLFVKVLEVNPALAVLGAIPALSKKAHDVATMHNIQVAEAPTPTELAEKILEIIGRT
jgi:hypothetical protein